MIPFKTPVATPLQLSRPLRSRIGIDGRNISLPRGTGVASYARVLMQSYQKIELIPELLLSTDPRRSNGLLRRQCETSLRVPRACLISRQVKHLEDAAGDPVLLSTDVFRIAQVHFNLYGTPLALWCENPPHVMHWTYPLPVYMVGVPNLVTIHDLIPLLQPGLTRVKGGRMERLIRAAIVRADYIITVSETVREQIIEILGVAPDRVVNCYQAVEISSTLLRAAERAPRLCPPGSFICFGTEMRRKNLTRLIEAHAASGAAPALVVISPDKTVPRAGKNVLHVPWASRASLIRAMQEATAVLFPSLAEGFGLPIVEAMALGTPVMTSRGGATEEIAGGAALLVDPLDAHDMAAAIAALASQTGLRDRLRWAGLQRAAFFSDEAYTVRLQQFYRTAHII